MGLFDAIDVAGSGLAAERLRMDVTAGNLANAETTQGPNGQPYRRREVVLQEAPVGDQSFGSMLASASGSSPVNGVQVAGIVEDGSPPRQVYDPGNPAANAQGYVLMPNVNPVTEMVDLISASRSYEANVTAMQASKSMFAQALGMLR